MGGCYVVSMNFFNFFKEFLGTFLPINHRNNNHLTSHLEYDYITVIYMIKIWSPWQCSNTRCN